MNTSIFIWLIYAFWLILITYLIVSAIGVKQETRGHSLQSVGLLVAIIASFLLPHLLHITHFLYLPWYLRLLTYKAGAITARFFGLRACIG